MTIIRSKVSPRLIFARRPFPRAVFDELISKSADFHNFIFTANSRRITDLVLVFEEIAFHRIDIRLAHKMLELARGTSQIKASQRQMAAELGTAREVVSRQLGGFQRRGWVSQARGVIAIQIALERLAAFDPA